MRAKLRMPSPSFAVSLLALIVALGGASFSATGGNFILGRGNAAATQTSLTSPVNGRTLNLFNTSTGANATALGLSVARGRPAFSVNTTVKIERLNADLLDGLNSTSFARLGVNEDEVLVSFLSGEVRIDRCEDFALTVDGAKEGEAVLISVKELPPEGIIFHGGGVLDDDTVLLRVCNHSGITMPTITDLPLRVLTFR
jgi:hypothetical protein